MANLKEIRSRIASVSSTMQITSAMKMVSAAKLKKAQDAITAMRPYADTLTELLQNLSGSIEDASGIYMQRSDPYRRFFWLQSPRTEGYVADSIHNIIKEVVNQRDNNYAGKQVDVFTIGKKGMTFSVKTFRLPKTVEIYLTSLPLPMWLQLPIS